MTRGVTLVLLTSFIVFLHSVKTVTVDTVHWTLGHGHFGLSATGIEVKGWDKWTREEERNLMLFIELSPTQNRLKDFPEKYV